MSARSKRTLGVLFIGLSVAGFGGPAAAQRVSVDASLGTPILVAGEKQTAYLRIALSARELENPDQRPPINVAFVLDKSGSMQGEKIAHAKQAARMAIGKLRHDDIVSIVAYDSTVQILLPATRLSDRKAAYAAIDRLHAGGTTALFAGVSKGAGELRKFKDRGHVNRMILLSDGIANVGPSSPADLGELGASLGREGISVTTIGLGLDYNEDLMTRLARSSDGNHMFAESPGDLELVFAQEFGDVTTVVAQEVQLEIRCSDGVRPVRLLGRDGEIEGQNTFVSLHQLYGGQMKYAILEAEVPAGEAGAERAVAHVKVSYLDMVTGEPANVDRNVLAGYTDSKAVAEAAINAEVMADVVHQIGVERSVYATQLRDEGKIEEAEREFNANAAFLRSSAVFFADPRLEELSVSNEGAAQNLDDENWNVQRKVLRAEEHQIKTQQSITPRSRN